MVEEVSSFSSFFWRELEASSVAFCEGKIVGGGGGTSCVRGGCRVLLG